MDEYSVSAPMKSSTSATCATLTRVVGTTLLLVVVDLLPASLRQRLLPRSRRPSRLFGGVRTLGFVPHVRVGVSLDP